ncbi:MAG: RibD family protein, partial [Pseudomonadota bacterium]
MFLNTDRSRPQHRAMEYDGDTAMLRLARHMGDGPFVIGQLGQSLDGRIATPTGHSKYINGQEALTHLHLIRSLVDAVIVGVGTAVADDPQLTTRHVPGENPARVVIDPHGRMPESLTMLSDGAAPVYAVTCPDCPVPDGVARLAISCDGETGHIAPAEIIEALRARGMTRVLVEGGAETLARFLNAGCIDELHLMVAPIVLGSGIRPWGSITTRAGFSPA